MKINSAYIVGIHRHCFRAGEITKITGVRFIQHEGSPNRLCYQLTYEDEVIDYIPVSDVEAGNYEYVTEEQIQYGDIPKVIR